MFRLLADVFNMSITETKETILKAEQISQTLNGHLDKMAENLEADYVAARRSAVLHDSFHGARCIDNDVFAFPLLAPRQT